MNSHVLNGMVALLAFGVAFSAYAAGDPAKGKAAYEICAVCHGASGEGTPELNVPKIGGQEEWYVARQLQNFKSGLRAPTTSDVYGTQMRALSMTLTNDQEIADVAAYVASMSPPAVADTVSGDAAQGKAAYATCTACHGANGEGNKALNSPKLAGQHDWYIVRQLQNYKSGVRGGDSKNVFDTQMRPMAMILTTDEAVNNIAAYINSLD
ncbi:MAG: c-type cytochrome [Gammaproteobacteria bacterium]